MDLAWFKARKDALGLKDAAIAEAIGRERSVANKIMNGKVPFDVAYADGFAQVFKVSREEILRRGGILGDAPAGLISVEELTEILAEAQGELSVGLPFSEWPRAYAEAAQERIARLLSDRSRRDNEDRQAPPARAKGARPPSPTSEAGQA